MDELKAFLTTYWPQVTGAAVAIAAANKFALDLTKFKESKLRIKELELKIRQMEENKEKAERLIQSARMDEIMNIRGSYKTLNEKLKFDVNAQFSRPDRDRKLGLLSKIFHILTGKISFIHNRVLITQNNIENLERIISHLKSKKIDSKI